MKPYNEEEKHRQQTRGQSLVEFALLFPILIMSLLSGKQLILY